MSEMLVSAGASDLETDGHQVHFYRDAADLASAVGVYLAAGLDEGAVGLVIATPGHAAGFRDALDGAGVDVAAAMRSEQLLFLDARETLGHLILDGRIDDDGFRREIAGRIGELNSRGLEVRAYGEMVDLLWRAGDVGTAIELEQHWHTLVEQLDMSLLCAYSAGDTDAPEHRDALAEVRRLHTVFEPDSGAPELVASRRFPPEPEAAFQARRFVAETLAGWRAEQQRVSDSRLLVSELVTNAILHARTPMTVSVRAQDPELVIAVSDESPAEPAMRPFAVDSTSGRGLHIVETLASEWGVSPRPDGKTVWAKL